MAYDDGYYYGQCKIVAVVDDAADNGKTVLITTDDNKTYSGTIDNKKCEFLLPPRTLYTVQKVSSGSAEFTTKVEAGYGDCILVHLDTGYVEVKQGDIVGLDYIKAATDDNLKNKVPEAKAVKELHNGLGGFAPIIDSTGKITGYKTTVGADTVFPFSSLNCTITGTLRVWTTWRVNNGAPFQAGYLYNKTVTIVIRDGVVESITNNSGGGSMSSFPNNTGGVSVAFGINSIKLD